VHFSGPAGDYRELLNRVHCTLVPRTYAEIGLSEGRSFSLALPGTKAVGIDPTFRKFTVYRPSTSDVRCYSMTSDDFFARHDLRRTLDGQPLDLAFIDGMHLFEYALRDFANLERCAGTRSIILLHDCNPATRLTASRERTPGHKLWASDVWKVVACLKQERPDLDITVVDVAPTGLGIITNLDPSSRVLRENYSEIVAKYRFLDYTTLEHARADVLNLVPDDWSVVRSKLPSVPFRADDLARLVRQRKVSSTMHAPRRLLVQQLTRFGKIDTTRQLRRRVLRRRPPRPSHESA
jgi:hypothetical protein